MNNIDKEKNSLYISGSKLNKAFIDKVKDYENIEELIGIGCALADLEESFNKILGSLYLKIESTSKNDYVSLLDSFTELWMELKHIDYHINEAEPIFLKLTNLISEKIESLED